MEQSKDYRHIVRIANTDIKGEKSLYMGLARVKGMGFMFSHAVCFLSGIDPTKKVGDLKEDEVKKIESIVRDPTKFGVPAWMLNRRKDPDNGSMKHLLTSDLTFIQDNDIKMMKKIKSYKGIRHSLGQPVRGQRTKSNFRKNKGKVHLGVVKKKIAPEAPK